MNLAQWAFERREKGGPMKKKKKKKLLERQTAMAEIAQVDLYCRLFFENCAPDFLEKQNERLSKLPEYRIDANEVQCIGKRWAPFRYLLKGLTTIG